jgi:uncharacterized repeat protein (TIGR02543 family)
VTPSRDLGAATYSPGGGSGGAGGPFFGLPGGAGSASLTFIVASYPLTYDANGATGGAVPANSGTNWIYDTAVTVPDNSGGLTRPGYAFTGWNTAADGSGTGYGVSSTITMRAAATLYAQWTLLPAPASASAGPAPSTPAGPAATPPARLSARYSVKARVVTSTGTLPTGSTRVSLGARSTRGASTTGRCRLTKRAFTCTVRLARGTWTVTTTARGAAGVVAQSSRRVVVR